MGPVRANRERLVTRRQILQAGVALGAAGLMPAPLGCRRFTSRLDRPNVLLVTLDTTRADHLGCYGYPRATSPNLDDLAREATVYTRAIAPGTWTLPSHASLFTGKCPASHGVRYDPTGPLMLSSAIPDKPTFQEYRVRGLAESETTLAALLTRAGYRTGGVAGGPWLKRVFGLANGFESWDDDDIGRISGRLGAGVTASAVRWLESAPEPFFLFLNYFDPHSPWSPPAGFADPFLTAPLTPGTPESPEQLLALYDGEIRYADHQLGEVVATLKRRGLYDRTWIIVTSDHGELIGEHGRNGHGDVPYQEVLHVPLISKPVRGDGGVGERSEMVQLTDVLPLVLARLGLPKPEGIQGGIPPDLGRPIIAESYTLAILYDEGDWRAIFDGSRKLMWNSQGRSALYDLATDPHESTNLLPERLEEAATMERAMNDYLAALPRSQANEPLRAVDDATRDALKNLGYLR